MDEKDDQGFGNQKGFFGGISGGLDDEIERERKRDLIRKGKKELLEKISQNKLKPNVLDKSKINETTSDINTGKEYKDDKISFINYRSNFKDNKDDINNNNDKENIKISKYGNLFSDINDHINDDKDTKNNNETKNKFSSIKEDYIEHKKQTIKTSKINESKNKILSNEDYDENEDDEMISKINNRIKKNLAKPIPPLKPSTQFKTIPYYLLIPGFIFLLLSIILLILQIVLLSPSLLIGLLTFFTFFISIFILSHVEIENITINTAKQHLIIDLKTPFLSRRRFSLPFKDISFIEMVRQGIEKSGLDTGSYFIRLTLYDKQPLVFGKTLSYDKIKHKYLSLLSLVKGIKYDDIPKYFLKDETVYSEFKEKIN